MTSKVKWGLIATLLIIAGLAAYGLTRSNPTIQEAIASSAPKNDAVPSSGRITLLDLGAGKCIPCKMMAPILEELKKEYAGRAEIIFIDVWENPEQARNYGIRAIPTQIFFDADGREVHRHTGFMDKKSIVEILTRLGVS
jgi:thioredoxin 1